MLIYSVLSYGLADLRRLQERCEESKKETVKKEALILCRIDEKVWIQRIRRRQVLQYHGKDAIIKCY